MKFQLLLTTSKSLYYYISPYVGYITESNAKIIGDCPTIKYATRITLGHNLDACPTDIINENVISLMSYMIELKYL